MTDRDQTSGGEQIVGFIAFVVIAGFLAWVFALIAGQTWLLTAAFLAPLLIPYGVWVAFYAGHEPIRPAISQPAGAGTSGSPAVGAGQ